MTVATRLLIINNIRGSAIGRRCLTRRYTPNATSPGTTITIRFCLRTVSSVTAKLKLGRTRKAIRCNMMYKTEATGPRTEPREWPVSYSVPSQHSVLSTHYYLEEPIPKYFALISSINATVTRDIARSAAVRSSSIRAMART